jgi:hypothetical protein
VVAVERRVARQVEVEVTRQQERRAAEIKSQIDSARRLTAADVTSEEVVQTLMKKMRALAREEQFRLGRLR